MMPAAIRSAAAPKLFSTAIDQDGRPVPTGLDSRMIVTSGHVLATIPSVIAIAYGVSKSAAVHAAIRGGMIHGLVTHTSMARALLSGV